MSPNIIWLLPPAGILLGFAASLAFIRFKVLSAAGYSHYRSRALSRSLVDLTNHKSIRIIDIRDIGLPNTIDDRRLNREPFSAPVAKTPTYGIPKPVDADQIDGGPMTQAELGASLSSLASVNPDSLHDPVDFAEDDLLPEREGFLGDVIGRHMGPQIAAGNGIDRRLISFHQPGVQGRIAR